MVAHGAEQVALGPQQAGLGIIHLKAGLDAVFKTLFRHLQQPLRLAHRAGQGANDPGGFDLSVTGGAQFKADAVLPA